MRPSFLRGLLVAGSLAIGLAGCGPSDSAAGLRVATGFYPLQYVAARVAGDRASVENLTEAGAEPHELSLSVPATALLAEADLVIHLGGFQPIVDDAIRQNAEGTVLDAADVVTLRPVEAPGADVAQGAAGDLDPHFWQDPLLMADLADALATDLAALDPAHAAEYRHRARALRGVLEDLDRDYARHLSSCERTTVVVSHDAFGYLGRYGLTLEPIAGVSPDVGATPADLERLQRLITDEGITTVFSETLASRELADTLASDLGIETAVLDPVEGLSDRTAEEDYLSLMRANLAALREANAC